mgnify:CR=1 FL=1
MAARPKFMNRKDLKRTYQSSRLQLCRSFLIAIELMLRVSITRKIGTNTIIIEAAFTMKWLLSIYMARKFGPNFAKVVS